MHGNLRRVLASQQERSKIGHDYGIHAYVVKKPQVSRQFVQVPVVQERVDSYMDAHVVRMSIRHGICQLAVGKVVRACSHAPTLARQVHGIGTKSYGGSQLLGSTGRCEQLH
jgi:hypothetical protein